MKSWKTTVFGLIAAVAGYVATNPTAFAKWPWVGTVAGIIMAAGIGSMGLASKDSDVHSTSAEVSTATVQAIKQSQP